MQQEDNEILPVEKRKLKGYVKHVIVTLPGLHAQWVTPRKFMYYVLPPPKLVNGGYDSAIKEKWLETVSFVLDDIWWLCELQYHQFWSQILFDQNSMNGIESFLHLAPLQQLYFRIEDQEMLLLYKKIKKAVFQFLKRLLRIKESDMNFMSVEKYREIMNEKNLVSLPLIFCLCNLYAKKDLETVRKMVNHIFEYKKNLKIDTCVVYSIQLFSRMKKKLTQSYRDLKHNMKYCDTPDDVQKAINAYRQNLVSSVQFLANAALSISNLLHVHVESCEDFLKHDLDFYIVRIYKKLVVPAYLEISILFKGKRRLQSYSKLMALLELSRLELVKSFGICLEVLFNRLSLPLLIQETIQHLVQLIKSGSRVENFLIDVNNLKNLSEFHEHIKKKCPSHTDLSSLNHVFESVDEKLNNKKTEEEESSSIVNGNDYFINDDEIYSYIKNNYDSENDDPVSESENDALIENDAHLSSDCSSEFSDWSKNENSDLEYEDYLETENGPDDSLKTQFSQMNLEPVPSTSSTEPVRIYEIELQSAISQIKDLLPHLGEGFIAICLETYNMNVSAVINSVLENTLPESLNVIDFSLSVIPPEILKNVKSDFDEPSSDSGQKLKELKRVEYSSYKDMLNDKKAVNQVKEIYEKYSNTVVDVLYDDDVDDDYEDDQLFAPVEKDPEGFYTEYGRLPLNNPNRAICDEEESPESENNTESETNSKQNQTTERREGNQVNRYQKPLDFCENPEEVRARRERRYQAKQYHRREFSNSNYKTKEDSERDNRHHKNVHKSSQANHSRRFLSDRKRKQ